MDSIGLDQLVFLNAVNLYCYMAVAAVKPFLNHEQDYNWVYFTVRTTQHV